MIETLRIAVCRCVGLGRVLLTLALLANTCIILSTEFTHVKLLI